MHHDIAATRRAIAALASSKYVRRYPAELRAQLVALVRAHPEHGIATLARRLDMAPQTLEGIVAGAAPAFVPVRVVDDAPPAPGVVVRGPRGVVVEGLDVDGVAALLRALS